MIDNVEVVK